MKILTLRGYNEKRRQRERRTFRLAVGAVLVVFLSQHFGQDGLVLLVQLLGLLPLRTSRHNRAFFVGPA